jgi:hypothetical protein
MTMMKFLPPRLRMPVQMLVVGAVGTAIGVILWGWAALVTILPFTLIVAAWYYYLGGGDSDAAAVVLGHGDERQAYRRLQMQALGGRVLSMGIAVVSIAAVAAKATLWPVVILIGLIPVSLLAGWMLYRERPGPGEQQVGH